MALKLGAFSARILPTVIRKYSTSGPMVNIALDEKTGITTATLNRPPVNSLNLDLLTELSNILTELEKNKSRGLIITSSSNTVFSGGLDLFEMYKPDEKRATQFWTTLQQFWMKLYGSSYPTVAVINGHSPAGGCLVAMSCEYRIMLNNFTIGLNETQLGMVCPPWFIATMLNTIGRREAELALTAGRLFKTEEALQIGLVDEIASSKDEAIGKAYQFFQRFAKVVPNARALTKQVFRQKDIKDLAANAENDLNTFVTSIKQEKFQKVLEGYMAALKQKSKQ